MENLTYLLNSYIKKMLHKMILLVLKRPYYFRYVSRIIKQQRMAIKRRTEKNAAHSNLQIPPYLIFSVTSACNLNCKGCYAKAQHRKDINDIDNNILDKVFSDAEDLGISTVITAGGEPFSRNGLIDILGNHSRLLFTVFTNGLLIDSDMINKFKEKKNIIPIISIEGNNAQTDSRRGSGVYKNTECIMSKLHKSKVPFGISVTVTKDNINTVTEEAYAREIYKKGSAIIFYIEYIPFEKGTENLVLDANDLEVLAQRIKALEKRFKMLFVSFPGDESVFGGCLSSGRGFIHIAANGDVEPCPFAPYSVDNIKNITLKQALESEYLKAVRESAIIHEQNTSGCTLFKNEELVKDLLKNNVTDISPANINF